MKNIILMLLFFSFVDVSVGQSYFAKRLQVGTSGDLVFDRLEEGRENYHKEITWSNHIAVSLSKNFWFGFMHNNIWAESNLNIEREKFTAFLLGAFIRYAPRISDKVNGRVQLGYSMGNYCTCGLGDPYLQDNLNYISWGLGIDVRLYKRLYADVGMNFNNIVSEADGNYNYNILAVGLNYKFGNLD